MSHCVVTGAAGFIGSHLCETLLAHNHEVIGIDAWIPYYDRRIKEDNLSTFVKHPNFHFHELDLREDDLTSVLRSESIVFHLAAMPGLLRSWDQFDDYLTCNVQATQRLLETAVVANVAHFIYCSTSSVYGHLATGDEMASLEPVSPYGITKLAAEHLCRAYEAKDDLPVTILRLFSVYGPRQRPDMGYYIFIERILRDELITIDGDGTSSRSNTFVSDCVKGIILAAHNPAVSQGETFNLGGGEEVSVNQVLSILAEVTGKSPLVRYGPIRAGDQRRTSANIDKAHKLLGYLPEVTISEGLRMQLEWYMRRHTL